MMFRKLGAALLMLALLTTLSGCRRQAPASASCDSAHHLVNVSGIQLCAPNTNGPTGPTAKCNDGTYSYAAHHQGACSHHGGVAVFY